MKDLTSQYQNDKLEFIKNPVVAEFLGLASNTDFTESDIEKKYFDKFAEVFDGAWQRVCVCCKTAAYSYRETRLFHRPCILQLYSQMFCSDRFENTEKITHQDVGQMDMYIRMYDELKRSEGDNPTIGIVLCSDTDEDIARYSVLHGNEQLFASKYKLYLPTEEELRAEIETQKAMFLLQQKGKKKKIEMSKWQRKVCFAKKFGIGFWNKFYLNCLCGWQDCYYLILSNRQ